MKYDVFISYRRNPDQDVANSILWALKSKGYTVSTFATAAQAADYLNAALDGVTVGIGGSLANIFLVNSP